MALIVIAGVLLLIVVTLAGVYNKLVSMKGRYQNAFAQIAVQLKRRHDLIPNLVETVKGFAAHEKSTLQGVIEARSKAVSATGVEAQGKAEGELSSALGRLMVVVEQYPDIKANQNFLSLQEELTSTENRIGFSRQHYNDSVMTFNTKIEVFPNNIFAGMFSFAKESFFEVEVAAEREAPKVQF